MTRRILDVERLPTEPDAVHRTRRADPTSIVLQAGLLAAGDLAPAGPHHLGGRPLYVGDTLLSAIPEWCARQVHDLVPDADQQEFEAILDGAREYREREDAPVPSNEAQPRRLNALAVAGFSGAAAIRLQRRGHALDRLVARCVAFTAELLKRRADGDRVRRFLLELDRELVIAHTRMLMRRCNAFEHENRLLDVVGRGGATERHVFCGEWAVVGSAEDGQALRRASRADPRLAESLVRDSVENAEARRGSRGDDSTDLRRGSWHALSELHRSEAPLERGF